MPALSLRRLSYGFGERTLTPDLANLYSHLLEAFLGPPGNVGRNAQLGPERLELVDCHL